MARTVTSYEIRPRSELRVEVLSGSEAEIMLKEGTAEVFGTELRLGERVQLRGTNVAIYSWEGGHVEVAAEPAPASGGPGTMAYVSDDTPMPMYLQLHAALDARRQRAFEAQSRGPCVVVAGPMDAGKSTITRMLGSWAARGAWQPALVDVDVGQGSITIPGSVSAAVLEAPVDIEEGIPLEAPLVFYYGDISPSDNPQLYRHLVEQLAVVLAKRAELDPRANAAGHIINTMGWVEGLGLELLLHTVRTFEADVVCVVGQDRLYAQLTQLLRGSNVEVLALPRSGGVVTRDKDYRRAARQGRLRDYFYGHRGDLQPHSQVVPAASLTVFQVTNPTANLPTTALPIGARPVSDPMKVTRVAPQDLDKRVLAVTYAADESDLLFRNVAGFVYVTALHEREGELMATLLCPRPGPLPGTALLASRFRMFLE